jgi:Fe-S cluster assembly protein SufD
MGEVETHLDNFRTIGGDMPETVTRLRATALEKFAALGFPTKRLEDWKYTNVATLATTPFRLPTGITPTTLSTAQLKLMRLGSGPELVFLNGQFAPELSESSSLPKGVQVVSLASALATSPERVLPRLGTCINYENASFTALNTAFIQDGGFVYVPKGVAVPGIIHFIFLSSPAGETTITHPRILIVAEEGSRVTVVETYVGFADSSYCTNAVTEIHVGANARVDHCKLQEEAEGAYHIATIQAHQDADSRFSSHSVSLGGGLVRNDIQTALAGSGSECTFDGLYLASGHQHVDHHTTIDHAQPHCTSRELYKGILDGQSSGVFNGKVVVRPEAQKSDAGQTNKNLLLSGSPVINTKPQLEIFADDVKCSHGATIGRLDDDALFFLRARGIGREEARRLLIHAFASEVIQRINVESLRSRLEQVVRARFHETNVREGSL